MARKLNSDTEHRNLYKRGAVWYFHYMFDGKRIIESTGTGILPEARGFRDDRLEKVKVSNERDRLANIQRAIGDADQRIEEIKSRGPSMTVMTAFEAFKIAPKGVTHRGRKINPGYRTLEDYEGRWNTFCGWLDKNYPTKKTPEGIHEPRELRAVTKHQAAKYIAEVGTTRSGNTRNKTLTFLRLFFKVLAKDAFVAENPFEGLEASENEVTRKRPLNAEELLAVAKQLEGRGEMETLFSLGYFTGARLGDCALLRWDNIRMGKREIEYTPRKTRKKNEPVTVKIHHTLLGLLEAVPKNRRRGLVLPELGTLYMKDPSALSKRIQKVFTDAGIETDLKVDGYSKKLARVGFHSLRHAFITSLLEGGAPMEAVRQQAGHSTIGMTAHYYHASDRALQAAQDALPSFGRADTPQAVTDAAGATLGGILALLDGLSDSELRQVIEQAGSIMEGRAGK